MTYVLNFQKSSNKLLFVNLIKVAINMISGV